MKYKVTISTYWERFSVIQTADNKSAAKYRVFKYLKKIVVPIILHRVSISAHNAQMDIINGCGKR